MAFAKKFLSPLPDLTWHTVFHRVGYFAEEDHLVPVSQDR